MTFGMGLTAAGTVRDSHPIPYYSTLSSLSAVETDNGCKGRKYLRINTCEIRYIFPFSLFFSYYCFGLYSVGYEKAPLWSEAMYVCMDAVMAYCRDGISVLLPSSSVPLPSSSSAPAARALVFGAHGILATEDAETVDGTEHGILVDGI